jgi:hypothetical protein
MTGRSGQEVLVVHQRGESLSELVPNILIRAPHIIHNLRAAIEYGDDVFHIVTDYIVTSAAPVERG